MRLLCIDPNGAALDFTWRAKEAGHDVRHFIRDTEKTKWIGEGMVEVVRDYGPFLDWSDLIFMADNVKYGPLLDQFRASNPKKLIVGPTREQADWELDRSFGQQILKDHGIEPILSFEFTDYDRAIGFVKKNPIRWVSKPSGDADKALSYCASGPADMVYMLEKWKKVGKQRDFILQEFIPGIEMAVGGWFGPGGWNRGWCENFEFKKLMDGDMGVATGEQGTVLRYVAKSRLAHLMLEPLTDTLEREGYCGYIDVNCIIDEKGQAWPLEFTMRPGWPTFNIEQELREGDPVEWLKSLSQGIDSRNAVLDRIAIGVVLSIPDYPYSHLTRKEVVGAPVYSLTTALLPHVHYCEVQMGMAPVDRDGRVERERLPLSAGDYILVLTSTGDTVEEARRACYRRLKAMTLPNSPMWRTDIGSRLSRQLPQLQEMGFAMGMEYSTNPPL